jgi:hypothetical protein
MRISSDLIRVHLPHLSQIRGQEQGTEQGKTRPTLVPKHSSIQSRHAGVSTGVARQTAVDVWHRESVARTPVPTCWPWAADITIIRLEATDQTDPCGSPQI